MAKRWRGLVGSAQEMKAAVTISGVAAAFVWSIGQPVVCLYEYTAVATAQTPGGIISTRRAPLFTS